MSYSRLSFKITSFPLDSYIWVTYVVISFYAVALPLWILLVLRNRYTRPVLKSGWIPVLSALLISG